MVDEALGPAPPFSEPLPEIKAYSEIGLGRSYDIDQAILREATRAPEADSLSVDNRLDRIRIGTWNNPEQSIGATLNALRGAGVVAAKYISPIFVTEAQRRGQVAAVKWERDNGTLGLEGPGVFDARRAVRNVFAAHELLRSMPANPDDEGRIAKEVLTEAVTERRERMRALPAPSTEIEAPEEIPVNKALDIIDQWSPEEARMAYRWALRKGGGRPRNNVEASVMSVPGDEWENFSFMLPDVVPNRAHQLLPTQMGQVLELGLGEGSADLFRARYDAGKVAYFKRALGQHPDGSPGTGSGTNPLDLVPGKNLRTLIDARALSLINDPANDLLLDPKIQEFIRSRPGPAADVLRYHERQILLDRMSGDVQTREQKVAQAREAITSQMIGTAEARLPETALTPGEAAKTSFAVPLLGALQASSDVPQRFFNDTIERLRASPIVADMIRRGGEMVLPQFYDMFRGAIGDTAARMSLAKDIAASPTAFGGEDARETLLSAVESPLEHYTHSHARQLEQEAKYQGALSNPKSSILDKAKAGAWLTFSAGLSGIVQPLYMLADDPKNAVGLLTSGVAFGAAAKFGTSVAAPTLLRLERGVLGGALTNHLTQLSSAMPSQALRLLTGFKGALDQVRRAGEAGKDVGGVERTLVKAIAVTGSAIDQWQRTGRIADPSGFAVATADAVPLARAHLGSLAGGLMERQSLFEALRDLPTRLFGKTPAHIDKGLFNTSLGALDANPILENAGRAIKSLLDADGFTKIFSDNLTKWTQDNPGRRPTIPQLVDMMPEVHRNLAGLLLEADHLNLKDSPLQTAMGKLLRTFPQQTGRILEGGADAVRELGRVAVDNMRALTEWGSRRARTNVLIDVAERSVQTRLDTADALLKGLPEELFPGLAQQFSDSGTRDRAALTALGALRKAAETHDFRKPFSLPTPEQAPALWNEIDPHTMGMILDAHGGLFGGLTKEALFDYKKVPMGEEIKVRAQEATRRVRDLEERLDRLERGPLAGDEVYAQMRNTRAALGRIDAKMKRGEALTDPETALVAQAQATARATEPADVLAEHLEKTKLRMQERGRGLLDGTIKSAEHRAVVEELDIAREEARAAWREATADRHDLVPSDAGIRGFRDLFDHDGSYMDKGLEQTAGQIAGARELGFGGNPFLFRHLPVHMVPAALRHIANQGMLATEWFGSRVDRLQKLYDKMTPADRVLLGLAQRTGVLPARLAERYPQLLERRGAEGADVALVDALRDNERILHQEYFRRLGKSGTDTAEVEAQRARMYDATYYAAKERPKMAGRVTEGGQAIQALGGAPREGGPVKGLELDEIRFKSDPTHYRVRVGEPGGIVDETFPDEAGARQFLLDRYGPTVFNKTSKSGGILFGTTLFGDRFSLAEPLGDRSLDVNQPIRGWTPELRLTRIEQGLRDTVRKNIFSAMSLAGKDMVLDADEMRQVQLSYGNNAVKRYMKVPDTERFGDLAGKYIHRDIARELVRGDRHWNFLDAVRQGLLDAGEPMPSMLVSKFLAPVQGAMDSMNQMARASLITYSPRTYLMNAVLNWVLFDPLVGGPHVLGVEAAGARAWVRKMIHDPAAALADPDYAVAKRLGVLRGMTADVGEAARASRLDMVGVDADTVAKNIADRRAKLEAYGEAVQAGRTAEALTLQKDLAALEEAQDRLHMGTVRRVVRNIADFFGNAERTLEQPTIGARLHSFFKNMYSLIDVNFRGAKWKALVDSGVDPETSARRITEWTPTYTNLPRWLFAGPKWTQPLVMSFPYEVSRIVARGLARQAPKLITLFSIVPAWNMMQMARGGVSWEAWDRIMKTRGPHNVFDQAMNFMTNVYDVTPNGQVRNVVDLSNVFSPAVMLGGHGLLDHIIDDVFPEKDRTALTGLLAAGGGWLSNFAGNSIPLNILGGLAFNRDPMTGKPLLPDRPDMLDRMNQWARLLGSSFLPPLAPGGRDFWNMMDAWDAPRNPKTGKPEYMRAIPSAVIRALIGIGIKGAAGGQGTLVDDQSKLASILFDVNDALGPGDTTSQPIDSPQRQQRSLARMAIDMSRTDEERTKARAALEKSLAETVEEDVDGVKAVKGRTDRQVQFAMKRMMDEGADNTFSRMSLDRQALSIVLAERAGINDKAIRDLIIDTQFNENGRPDLENDPDVVRKAIGYLQEGARRPGANPRLTGLIRWLEPILQRAEAFREVEKLRTPFQEQTTQEIRKVLHE